MIFTGTSLQAEEAVQIGLIERISTADSLMNDAITLAKQITKMDRSL